MSYYEKITYVYCVPPMIVICLISVIINLKVLMCIYWIRRPLSPILMTSLSLAMADACTSILLGIALFLNSYLNFVHGILSPRIVVTILEMFRLSGCIVTVAHLFALSVHHYLGISKPLHYQALMTTTRVLTIIVLLWVSPIGFIATYFLVAAESHFWHEDTGATSFMDTFQFRSVFSSLFFVPLILMTLFYVHIVVIVRKQQKLWAQLSRSGSTRWKAVKTTSKQSSTHRSEQRQMEGNVRAIKTTLLILGSCVLGWMPAVLVFLLMCKVDCPIHGETLMRLYEEYNLEMLSLMWLQICFLILKTLVNPIIYTTRMKEIQDGTQKMHSAFLRAFCGSRGRQRPGQNGAESALRCVSETTIQEKKTSFRLLRINSSVKHRSVSPTDLLNTLL